MLVPQPQLESAWIMRTLRAISTYSGQFHPIYHLVECHRIGVIYECPSWYVVTDDTRPGQSHIQTDTHIDRGEGSDY